MNTVISNRDKMLIEYAGYFFSGRIAGSVFGYRYRLDRPASHQHCFHLIASSHLKTFWEDLDSDNQDNLEYGYQDLLRTSSLSKRDSKIPSWCCCLAVMAKKCIKIYNAHAQYCVMFCFCFWRRFVATICWDRHWYQILIKWILMYMRNPALVWIARWAGTVLFLSLIT